jgi:hypothetical protein
MNESNKLNQTYLNIIYEEDNKFENKEIKDILNVKILTENPEILKKIEDNDIENTIKEVKSRKLTLARALHSIGKKFKNIK